MSLFPIILMIEDDGRASLSSASFVGPEPLRNTQAS
jgi:hypothetical protein